MGLGPFDAGDFVPDPVEDVVEKGKEKAGEGVDWAGDKAAGGLDRVGWEGGADWVRQTTDSAANRLGAQADELQLGQTDDPRKLVHGSVSKIRSTVSHLRDFQAAFERVGAGLLGLDSNQWVGRTADAFRERVAVEPRKWFTAADACERAADALERFAETVEWAQSKAREAIGVYNKAKADSEHARSAYNASVDRYNAAADSYNAALEKGKDPGRKPTAPSPFEDPGPSGLRRAQEILDDARRQRNDAAGVARSAIAAARDTAPDKPSYAEQVRDGFTGLNLDALHFTGGVAKGGAGLLNFAKSLNPLDPYNLAHPGDFTTNLNRTAFDLASAARHPVATGERMVDQFLADPAEGAGRMVPELLGTKGAGSARTVVGAAGRTAREAGRKAASADPHARTRSPGQRVCEGIDPVDLATGLMYLPQTDVVLPGTLPLVFGRHVESGYAAGRWFGPAWASTVDQHLEVDSEGVVFCSEDGLVLSYPHPAVGLSTLPQGGPRWPLERTREGDYALTDPGSGQVRHFTAPPGGGDGVAVIDQITDRHGNWITFDHTPEGTPAAITHHAGYRLRFTVEDDRITALHLSDATVPDDEVTLLRYGYSDGNLASVTNSSGLPLRFAYDGRGRLVSWRDTNDRSYHHTYDDRDRCVAAGGDGGHLTVTLTYTDPDPATGTTTTTVTTPEGHATRYVVNARRQVIATTDPLGATVHTTYDTQDRVTSRTDALGHTTHYRWDDAGNLVGVVRPDGREATAAYNTLGLPTALVGFDGATWHQEFDSAGNRTAVTDPAGAVTRFTHTAQGHLTAITDALGHTTHVECNTAGLPIEVTDPLGATTRCERDMFGRVTTVTDPLGHTTRLTWTLEGKLASRVQPDGAQESWTYDGEGNCVSHTDPIGGTTRFEYTHFDLLTARTTPDGVRYEFTHDTHLRLTQVTNPQGLTWTYTYDPAGRLTSETDFDDRTITYTHTPASQLASRTNPLGETTTYTHDVLGRVVEQDAGGWLSTFTYDPAGRLTQATNPDTILIWRRDRAGRITSETCNGRTITFTYDALGRRTRRITPTGVETTYTYDPAGRRTGLTTAGHTLTFTHDPAGQELTRTVDDTLTLTHTWDTAGRLTDQTVTAPTGLAQRRTYTYRPDGYLLGIDDHLNGPRRFTLDPVGRVTHVTATNWTEIYTYDPAGNQTTAHWPTTHPHHHTPRPAPHRPTASPKRPHPTTTTPPAAPPNATPHAYPQTRHLA
ncbi:putative T7SS-secreted protein, partial [Wenjunlia vitaminophila]|uniref:putative T7SS-secreted protein n=1 Tax=Wenjunlia vitaminophila TaxID=76728 RepID=UPI0012FF58FE